MITRSEGYIISSSTKTKNKTKFKRDRTWCKNLISSYRIRGQRIYCVVRCAHLHVNKVHWWKEEEEETNSARWWTQICKRRTHEKVNNGEQQGEYTRRSNFDWVHIMLQNVYVFAAARSMWGKQALNWRQEERRQLQKKKNS